MLREFLSSYRAPGVMRMLVTAIILLGFHSLAFSATDEASSASLEERVQAMKGMEERVKAMEDHELELTNELKRWEKAVAAAKANRAQKAELKDKMLLLKQHQAEIDELKSAHADIQGKKEELRKKLGLHREAIRSNFTGKEMAEMRSKDGKVYKKVKITGFDPQGMKFRHQDGMANLHHTMLPDELQLRFKFDPEEARKFTEQEAAKQKKWKRLPLEKHPEE